MDYFFILIPTYNPGAIFHKCLQSCLEQTYEGIMIFIYDDSTDNMVEQLVEYVNDDRIHYQRNPRRLGPINNWNKLLQKKRGVGYTKLLHHDEFFCTANAVASIVHLYESCPYLELVVNSHNVVDVDGTKVRCNLVTQESLDQVLRKPFSLLSRNIIGSPSNITMRHTVHLQYDNNLRWYVDVEAYIRAFRALNVGFIGHPIISSVSGSDLQLSRSLEYDYSAQGSEIIYILNKHKSVNELSIVDHMTLLKIILKGPINGGKYVKLILGITWLRALIVLCIASLLIRIVL